MKWGRVALLENGSATGTQQSWLGGYGAVYAEGTFGGATLTLQVQSPNGTWLNVGPDTTFTGNGLGGFFVPAGAIRIAVSGGSPSALYVYVDGLTGM
jgi:hypothetical protein